MDVYHKEKGKKVERYRPGKAPIWATEEEKDDNQESKTIQKVNTTTSINISIPNQIPKALIDTPPQTTPTPKPSISETRLYPEEEYIPQSLQTIRTKPTFVSKNKRATHIERETREQEQEEILKQLKDIQEEKKTRTKVIVAEAILKEEIGNISEDIESSSDDDYTAEEFILWKVREIKRIMRDKDEKERREKDMKEMERRRALSDWERREEDKVLGNDESAKPVKQKILYMQKYYNKGIFYQERDEHGKLPEIFMRDYNAPVEGDFDKSTLPKILQKRRGDFGKKGQSKYTHLTNEDTTNFDPMFMPEAELMMKQQMKCAGYKSMNKFDA